MLHYAQALLRGILYGLIGSLLGVALVAGLAAIVWITGDELETDPGSWGGVLIWALIIIPLSFLAGFAFGMGKGVSRPRS